MTKSLLIVESPAKARTIGKYLGPDFEVKASVGHIIDLPRNRMGVDLEGDFTPEYVTIAGKQKIINELKKAAKGKDVIYLAPDPDREGEAIAWHIAEALKAKGRVFSRVLFHELTPDAIRAALDNPEELSSRRFESQQARRILDRLVGYRLSPLLWDKVKRGLSAGRVQSVALRIITDREREIFAFDPEEYWSLTARLKAEGLEFSARLHKQDDKKIKLTTGEATREIIEAVKNQPFAVREVVSRERKRQPLPAFTTSQLQQEAFARLKLPAARTMRLAQQLYEGVDLGPEGAVGLITYMRTDSVRVANVAIEEARQVIKKMFGPDYLPGKPRYYRNKKGSQDAHEAIRPTSAARTPEQAKKYLSGQLLALYELIWRRFTASQMNPALIGQTTADIQAGRCTFRATGSVIKFKGFLEVYDRKSRSDPEILPPLRPDQPVDLAELVPKQHFTQPPPRFTEATLVKELEENGIGRPSTYASIISTLRDKNYVESKKGQLRPSELGFIVSDLLVDNFPKIMGVEFTAGMENELDEIEEGKIQWREVLERFYQPFEQDMARAQNEMLSLKRTGLKTEVKCEKCGADMVLKWSRNGPFLSCSRYPECKNAFDFQRDEKGKLVPIKLEAPETDEICEKCGRPMVMKNGRFGPFLACSGYPDCKNTKPVNGNGQAEDLALPEGMDPKCEKCGGPLTVKRNRQGSLFIACTNYPKCKNTRPYPTGVKCPKKGCGGDIVERSSQRGVFYGCSNYPKCRFTLRFRPVNRECPVCGSQYLIEANNKSRDDSGKTVLKCPDKNCDYTTTMEKKDKD
ncbi:MAG: type I DNA topoisomerase [Thermodesulfobacteriota bacterium]|nr:type I DNA topoisomerase [Thermodesulfobacteriota bacterium]